MYIIYYYIKCYIYIYIFFLKSYIKEIKLIKKIYDLYVYVKYIILYNLINYKIY